MRVWDKDGKVSDWSEPSRWTMGLLTPASWRAQWIAAPEPSAETDSLVVSKAVYRTLDGSVSVDVAAAMRRIVAERRLPYTVHFKDLGGDPAPNIVKELVVDYVWRGQPGVARARDFQRLDTPGVRAGHPAPWFRREFELAAKPDAAQVAVCSPGYVELYVNGEKVGGDVLTPAVSDLKQQTFAVTYDVRSHLRAGRNCIGLWAGNGWADDIAIRAQLNAVAGGATVVVGTDTEWKSRPSGYSRIGQRKWNDFGGERIDAALHEPDWCKPGFDDRAWSPVAAAQPPPGRVVRQPCPPNRIGERIPAVAVTALGEGRYEIDFGRNLTGWLRLEFPALERGQTVRMHFADRVFPDMVQSTPIGEVVIHRGSASVFPRADGGSNGYQTYHQVSEFVSAGRPGEFFQHKFNYAGFRYVVVEGLPVAPRKENAVALLVESDIETAGAFECSDPLLNRIHEVNRWTLRSLNLGGYPVDCPHRERMGYGDGQVSLAGMMMNFNAAGFYEKWARDWRLAQNPQDGSMPNVAPPIVTGGGGPPWAGVIAALPWQHYLHYGDRRILEENCDAARRYIEYLDARSSNDVLRAWGMGFKFIGDWVPPNRGMDTKNWPSKEMAEFFCNCYRVYLWQLVGQMASALGRPEESARAEKRVADIRSAVHAAFYDAANKRYVIDEQIYYAMPLLTGVTPESERAAVMSNLVSCLVGKNKGHLDTGMLGTLSLVDFLDGAGRDDLVLGLYQKKDYPGWGYMVEQGATTLWEQWNGYWSQIHSCFASADNWLYHGLAGIRPDPAAPGFKNVILQPAVVGDIRWVKAHHDGPYGRIAVEWRNENGTFAMDAVIPPNSTATVSLPDGATCQVGSGRHRWIGREE